MTQAVYGLIDFGLSRHETCVQVKRHVIVAGTRVCRLQQIWGGCPCTIDEYVTADQCFRVFVAMQLHIKLPQGSVEVNRRTSYQARTYERRHGFEALPSVPKIKWGEKCSQSHALDRLRPRLGGEQGTRLDEHRKSTPKHLYTGHRRGRGLILFGDSCFPVRKVDGRWVSISDVANPPTGRVDDMVVSIDEPGMHDAASSIYHLLCIKTLPQIGIPPDLHNA